jgi:hypothetical protein
MRRKTHTTSLFLRQPLISQESAALRQRHIALFPLELDSLQAHKLIQLVPPQTTGTPEDVYIPHK